MEIVTTLTAGKTRFQFYSDGLVRIEHSPQRAFRDRLTAVVIDRKIGGAQVEQEWLSEELILRTVDLTIKCCPDKEHWTSDDLVIEWKSGDAAKQWRLGDREDGNLGGTLRSLDSVGPAKLPAVNPGVLSRDMYFVLDDSATPAWDPETNDLAQQCDQGYHDLYFGTYESFQEALALFGRLTGNVPMIPRYALGLWFSRYYHYTGDDFKKIAEEFEKLGMPLDVMVLDVDWHKHGWEGYDWDTDLIPEPEELIEWFHNKGIRVSANVHPGGVPDNDSRASEAREALGLRPHEQVRFNLAKSDETRAYMDLLHRPIMDTGIDFWWIDGDAVVMDGLNAQHWTNAVYYDYTRRYSQARPMVLSRYGGFGSQRYPIGFSGDAQSNWAVLAYEVNFTSTAGNALMPYWSHDIGGFSGNHIDTELYIRWVQFGAMSPFLRLHSDHGDRAPWEYGSEAVDAFKKAYDLRSSLIPYLYSLCFTAASQSLPIAKPMYLAWPEDERCYSLPGQYMLGDSLLVCPVTYPAAQGRAHADIYLPDGTWYDFSTGRRYEGGRDITYVCPLDRIPIFVRAGAIIPMQKSVERTSTPCPDPLIVHLYPGANGEFVLYEDDGETQANENGEYALTRMSLRNEGDSVIFTIAPVDGGFPAMKPRREFLVHLHGVAEPESVSTDGTQQSYKYDAAEQIASVGLTVTAADGAQIRFDGAELAVQVPVEPFLDLSTALFGPDATGGNPRMVISAICEGVNDLSSLKLSYHLPERWRSTPITDDRNDRLVLDLDIPARFAPGHYIIGAQGSIEIGGKLQQVKTEMDWAFASVTDFAVIGTFDNAGNRGMDIAYGPETDFGFHPEHDGRKWEPLKEDAIVGDIMPLRYIDLTRHFGWINDVVAYAVTYIHSESPRDVRFDLGSDDGLIAWLNGKEIVRAPAPGPSAPAQYKIPVKLHAGWNQVMLKIGQLYGDWGFYFEIRNEDGEPAESLRVSREAV